MNNKQSATIINDFFADLTKDYPQINEEWVELECPDGLPGVSVEDVRKQLMKININKAPWSDDPVLKILKVLKSLYVDDLASGSNNPESTLELANKIKTLVYAGAHIPKSSGGECKIFRDRLSWFSILLNLPARYFTKNC